MLPARFYAGHVTTLPHPLTRWHTFATAGTRIFAMAGGSSYPAGTCYMHCPSSHPATTTPTHTHTREEGLRGTSTMSPQRFALQTLLLYYHPSNYSMCRSWHSPQLYMSSNNFLLQTLLNIEQPCGFPWTLVSVVLECSWWHVLC